MGSAKFWSKAHNITPYCIGIKHKYPTAYFALSAPFAPPQTILFSRFSFLFSQNGHRKLENNFFFFSVPPPSLLPTTTDVKKHYCCTEWFRAKTNIYEILEIFEIVKRRKKKKLALLS